jgi:hypothetical protein
MNKAVNASGERKRWIDLWPPAFIFACIFALCKPDASTGQKYPVFVLSDPLNSKTDRLNTSRQSF